MQVLDVLVVWIIGAFLLSAFTHVGQIYDPNIGAWFVDHSQDSETARWLGNAMLIGLVVSVALGAGYYLGAERPRSAGAERPKRSATPGSVAEVLQELSRELSQEVRTERAKGVEDELKLPAELRVRARRRCDFLLQRRCERVGKVGGLRPEAGLLETCGCKPVHDVVLAAVSAYVDAVDKTAGVDKRRVSTASEPVTVALESLRLRLGVIRPIASAATGNVCRVSAA